LAVLGVMRAFATFGDRIPAAQDHKQLTGGGQRFSTDQFALMGQKRADTAMSSISTRSLTLGRPQRVEPVVRSIR
jgi:hypothetical protein